MLARKYPGHKQVTHKPLALHSTASIAARLAAAALLAL
jgi:hypothetical protein